MRFTRAKTKRAAIVATPTCATAWRRRCGPALRAGEARWCVFVRLELWNGAGGDRERKALREFERYVPELDVTPEV